MAKSRKMVEKIKSFTNPVPNLSPELRRNEKIMKHFREFEQERKKEKILECNFIKLIKNHSKGKGNHITRDDLAKLIEPLMKSTIPDIYEEIMKDKKGKDDIYRDIFRIKEEDKNLIFNYIGDKSPEKMVKFLDNIHFFDSDLKKKSSFEKGWIDLKDKIQNQKKEFSTLSPLSDVENNNTLLDDLDGPIYNGLDGLIYNDLDFPIYHENDERDEWL
ncbi:hypothetical protein M9Y10_007207 [Tritrichomonas musculus]|uniref:Uncharacterized protein n=1 Tax=Tritrichomonas musculus TaxID=1915356 RepID=A0ABR2J1Z0_9EUKA